MRHNRLIWTPIILAFLFVSNALTTLAQETELEGPSYNHLFNIENIEGWVVYINKEGVKSHPREMEEALEHMEYQLYQVARHVPKPALSIMQEKVPLWVEYDTIGIAYHGRSWLINNGYKPPDVPTLAGFCRMKSFLNIAIDQPWVIFHELAHGYDFRYLRKDYRNGFPPVKEAYEKANESGRYQSVLCRYSDAAKHYGMNNAGEYFAECSEAYFGANDFYPFVRAELKESDPSIYQALEKAWGIDRQKQKERLNALLNYINKPQKSKIDSYIPTSKYTQTEIQGWNVFVSPELKQDKAISDAQLKLIDYKLHLVKRYVPEHVVKKMQNTTIWLKKKSLYDQYITYCSTDELKKYGLNPDMLHSVVIWNTGNFDRWETFQPSALLNRLAQAYYDNELGERKKDIETAWEKAKRNDNLFCVLTVIRSITPP